MSPMEKTLTAIGVLLICAAAGYGVWLLKGIQ